MNTVQNASKNNMVSIGPFKIFSDSGLISDSTGQQIHLEPRLSNLLLALCRNDGKMISRPELIAEVWPDHLVNEESLTRAISDLRKLLNSHFTNPPEILTFPKRGYKIVFPELQSRNQYWKKVIKYTIYITVGFIILVLVIRGLNY